MKTKQPPPRLIPWLIALALVATFGACASEAHPEGAFDQVADAGYATELEPAEQALLSPTWTDGKCSFDAQCPLGSRCVRGACKTAAGGRCTSDSDCVPGRSCKAGSCESSAGGECRFDSDCFDDKQCRAGSCQKTDYRPNNPCDTGAARAFGYMICRRLYTHSNDLTKCLQEVDRNYNHCGAGSGTTPIPLPTPIPRTRTPARAYAYACARTTLHSPVRRLLYDGGLLQRPYLPRRGIPRLQDVPASLRAQ